MHATVVVLGLVFSSALCLMIQHNNLCDGEEYKTYIYTLRGKRRGSADSWVVAGTNFNAYQQDQRWVQAPLEAKTWANSRFLPDVLKIQLYS